MATTTDEAVRNRVIALIKALVAGSHSRDRFELHRSEADGDFVTWATTNAQAAFRRFFVRDTGESPAPDTSNTDVESAFMVLEIIVAYPQDARTGDGNTLDRDVVMAQDRKAILRTVGLNGYANFTTATVPATPLVAQVTRVLGDGVDFLFIRQPYRFHRVP